MPAPRRAAMIGWAFFCMALFFLAGGGTEAWAQGNNNKVVATHGEWQVTCGRPPGSQVQKCAAVQSVTAEDRPNVGLVVMVLKLDNSDKVMLRVVAPLGVWLTVGLGLKIDDADMGRTRFVRCLNVGCIAEGVIDAKVLKAMSGGKTAIFIIFQTPEEGIAIPISLNGFDKSFAMVK